MSKGVQCCFKRVEKKYILNEEQYLAVKAAMEPHVKADDYANYTICNVYYDTPDFHLIRKSLDKPVYKEKLRVRSYGVANDDSRVFVELKKKYDGVVYKRRVTMDAAGAVNYLNGGPAAKESQISHEIDFFLESYRPLPKVFIAYDREAYAGTEDSELRITFDTKLRGRTSDVDLRAGDHGDLILPADKYLMEIKIPGTAPLWLAHVLSENKIFSTSFSKYGSYYKNFVLPELRLGAASERVRGRAGTGDMAAAPGQALPLRGGLFGAAQPVCI